MQTLNCLVIREEPIGESNKLIYVLTAERGVFSIFVRGGMKSTKHAAATQLHVYSLICFDEKYSYKGENYCYLNSAEPVRIFYNIRLDPYKASLAAYFAELLYYSGTEYGLDKSDVLRLALNTLHFLNEGIKDMELLKSIFEFRLLCEIGLRPNLLCCARCFKYEDDRMHFDLYSGELLCDDCCDYKDGALSFVFNKSLLYIVRHISLTDFDRLFSIKVSTDCQTQLTKFTESFVKYHFERSFNTLSFYRSL